MATYVVQPSPGILLTAPYSVAPPLQNLVGPLRRQLLARQVPGGVESGILIPQYTPFTSSIVPPSAPLMPANTPSQLFTGDPPPPLVVGDDYWEFGYDPLAVIPKFPPTRTMLMVPAENYARSRPVAAVDGDLFDAIAYPLENLTDGTSQTVCRFTSTDLTLLVDLGAAFQPNVVALLSHNLAEGELWEIIGANDSDLLTPLVHAKVASRAPTPHIWLDLRGFTFAPCRYWGIQAFSASQPITLGEIVIGRATELEGIIDPDFEIKTTFYGSREESEHGVVCYIPSGALSRETPLAALLDLLDQGNIEAVLRGAADLNERVFFAPTSRLPDCFWVESVARRSLDYARSLQEARVTLDFREESPGVVV